MALQMVTSHEVPYVQGLLRSTPIGEILSYQELSRRLGRPIKSSDSVLRTVLRHALRDEGIVVRAVPKVGYRRLGANGAVDEAGHAVRSVRNKAKKGLKIIRATEGSNELTLNNQSLAAVHRLRFNVMVELSGPQVTRRLRKTIDTPSATGDDILRAVKASIDRLKAKYDG